MNSLLLLATALAQPAAAEKPRTPAEIIAEAPASAWKAIAADDLLVVELKAGGRVTIQLAPEFAPVHVANVRALARGKWWDGSTVYRVQENYVVQWGNNEGDKPLPAGVIAKPPAEYARPQAGLPITPLGYGDPYAAGAGFAHGWPISLYADGQASLAHCYAAVGVGRDLSPDTGTGGELYAVIGHSPRHLDRNIAVVGRVIEGIEHFTTLPRGTEALGFYKDEAQHVPLARATLGGPNARFQYLDTSSPSFAAYVKARANRQDSFFIRPAGGVDLCNAPVPVRRVPKN